jgi:Protein of unknown function (DUF1214)
LISIKDKDGDTLDGSKTYRLTVPPNPPVEQYWSMTVRALPLCILMVLNSRRFDA